MNRNYEVERYCVAFFFEWNQFDIDNNTAFKYKITFIYSGIFNINN